MKKSMDSFTLSFKCIKILEKTHNKNLFLKNLNIKQNRCDFNLFNEFTKGKTELKLKYQRYIILQMPT